MEEYCPSILKLFNLCATFETLRVSVRQCDTIIQFPMYSIHLIYLSLLFAIFAYISLHTFFCYIRELFYRKEYRSCRTKKKKKKKRKKKKKQKQKRRKEKKILRREDENIVDRNVMRKPEKLGAYYFGNFISCGEAKKKYIYILDSRFSFFNIQDGNNI